MKPLIVLLSTFAISLLLIKFFSKTYDFALAGRIAMAIMLLFTAIAHVAFTKGMTMMLPNFIPAKTAVVYATGLMEVFAAIGLLFPAYRVITGWMLIAFFVLILPANIHAAIQHVDYQQATLDGKGLAYLWFRVPLQLLFIVWTYLSAIRG